MACLNMGDEIIILVAKVGDHTPDILQKGLIETHKQFGTFFIKSCLRITLSEQTEQLLALKKYHQKTLSGTNMFEYVI